jgi:UDP-N-acetylmuramoyl-L-alanyl-D-glutamate--2,6-diaminopimelate ligase
MAEVGCQYAVLEATSHGLAQSRLEACHFDLAVLTNITPEHLDYHRTFQEYQQAKARLFQGLISSKRKEGVAKVSILNLDDPSYERFRSIPADQYLTYGLHEGAQIKAQGFSLSPFGLRFTAQTPNGDFPVESPLVGKFNLWNLLAAIAVGVSQGLPFSAMQEGIQAMSGVVGRMEKVALGQPFSVIIDFAHTPNSLERALETARLFSPGRVISVFGCAGLRDRDKRPVMGEIAGRLADHVVITAEDPRTEPLEAIMAQIAQGCQRAGRREGIDFWRIADRKEAIRFALDMAQEGDLVLITGKGHERSMCFGTAEYPWSDHQAVREAMKGYS